MKKIKLNLGCGIYIKKDFINVDVAYDLKDLKAAKGFYKNAVVEKGGKYVKADIKKMPFKDNYADYVELLNTIEHFPMKEIVVYLKEIYRVMKPKAKLVILTNNFAGLALSFLQMELTPPFDINKYYEISEPIYGNQLYSGEYHLCPFTPSFMNYVLTQAGFKAGFIGILEKGKPVPKIGQGNPRAKKGTVIRNDLIYAEAKK